MLMPQAQNLQAPHVTLVGAPDVQLVGSAWDATPALDKGLLIGGAGTVLLGSVLGLAGQRLGATISFGVAGGIGAWLAILALRGLQNDNGGEAFTDIIGSASLSATVISALLIMGAGRR